MSDYLMREDAPLTEEVWAAIDETVLSAVRTTLVGRRVIDIVGPVGWGVEVAPLFSFTEEDGATIATSSTEYLQLVEIAKEFALRARQIATARHTPFSLDLGAAALAAVELAKAEDDLVIGGLARGAGCFSPLGDWSTFGQPFRAIAEAIAQLRTNDFHGPYAAIMSPTTYARLASLFYEGQRELAMVEALLEAGIYQSTDPEVSERVLVLSPQPWNMDLVIGQDVMTAWLGNEGLDQRFRIFETLALRLKRPGSVCVLS
ncbi:MAG TPA: bacteriocin family protein [Chloroflexi bacterium]|jgi:uncharacterized linocin/CFP29 family protein|nr:bacteriocin family protein [Chloroflexota bacterium]